MPQKSTKPLINHFPPPFFSFFFPSPPSLYLLLSFLFFPRCAPIRSPGSFGEPIRGWPRSPRGRPFTTPSRTATDPSPLTQTRPKPPLLGPTPSPHAYAPYPSFLLLFICSSPTKLHRFRLLSFAFRGFGSYGAGAFASTCKFVARFCLLRGLFSFLYYYYYFLSFYQFVSGCRQAGLSTQCCPLAALCSNTAPRQNDQILCLSVWFHVIFILLFDKRMHVLHIEKKRSYHNDTIAVKKLWDYLCFRKLLIVAHYALKRFTCRFSLDKLLESLFMSNFCLNHFVVWSLQDIYDSSDCSQRRKKPEILKGSRDVSVSSNTSFLFCFFFPVFLQLNRDGQ